MKEHINMLWALSPTKNYFIGNIRRSQLGNRSSYSVYHDMFATGILDFHEYEKTNISIGNYYNIR